MLSRIAPLSVALLLLAWMVPSAATALDADDAPASRTTSPSATPTPPAR